MNKVVFKYPLETGQNFLQLPAGCKYLKIGAQANDRCPDTCSEQLVLWVLCAPDSPLVTQMIRVVGTGQSFPENESAIYIDSVVKRNGTVWHAFASDSSNVN